MNKVPFTWPIKKCCWESVPVPFAFLGIVSRSTTPPVACKNLEQSITDDLFPHFGNSWTSSTFMRTFGGTFTFWGQHSTDSLYLRLLRIEYRFCDIVNGLNVCSRHGWSSQTKTIMQLLWANLSTEFHNDIVRSEKRTQTIGAHQNNNYVPRESCDTNCNMYIECSCCLRLCRPIRVICMLI